MLFDFLLTDVFFGPPRVTSCPVLSGTVRLREGLASCWPFLLTVRRLYIALPLAIRLVLPHTFELPWEPSFIFLAARRRDIQKRRRGSEKERGDRISIRCTPHTSLILHRERPRHRDTQRHRETERQSDSHRGRDKDRDREAERETETETDRDRQRDSDKGRDRGRDTDRDRR